MKKGRVMILAPIALAGLLIVVLSGVPGTVKAPANGFAMPKTILFSASPEQMILELKFSSTME
ncbi:MAG: hypothetical protein NTU83_04330 [Candidatus Hydrogenedentes bacterium]|nr:hypothetical protein [Candidatus Hydrogenedentota bacterium]